MAHQISHQLFFINTSQEYAYISPTFLSRVPWDLTEGPTSSWFRKELADWDFTWFVELGDSMFRSFGIWENCKKNKQNSTDLNRTAWIRPPRRLNATSSHEYPLLARKSVFTRLTYRALYTTDLFVYEFYTSLSQISQCSQNIVPTKMKV